MKIFGFFFFEKNVKFLAIFWQSNGNFPEGQLRSKLLHLHSMLIYSFLYWKKFPYCEIYYWLYWCGQNKKVNYKENYLFFKSFCSQFTMYMCTIQYIAFIFLEIWSKPIKLFLKNNLQIKSLWCFTEIETKVSFCKCFFFFLIEVKCSWMIFFYKW